MKNKKKRGRKLSLRADLDVGEDAYDGAYDCYGSENDHRDQEQVQRAKPLSVSCIQRVVGRLAQAGSIQASAHFAQDNGGNHNHDYGDDDGDDGDQNA